MKLPLWSLSPALMILTALYVKLPDFDYVWKEWFIGNSIILLGIGLIYFGEWIYKKYKD